MLPPRAPARSAAAAFDHTRCGADSGARRGTARFHAFVDMPPLSFLFRRICFPGEFGGRHQKYSITVTFDGPAALPIMLTWAPRLPTTPSPDAGIVVEVLAGS